MPKLQNCPHSLWASALTKVAPLRPRDVSTMGTITHNTHVIYGPWVHASGVHEGWNIVHGGQQKWKIAQNGQKCAHSWLGQMRHMPDSDRMCHRIGIKSCWSNISFGRRPTPPILGMAGSPSEPMIWDSPKSPTWRPRHAKPKRSYSPGPRYVGHRSMYPHIILGS